MKNIAPISPTMPQVQNQNLSADYVNLGGAKINIQGNHNLTLRINATTVPAVCFMQMAGIFVTPI